MKIVKNVMKSVFFMGVLVVFMQLPFSAFSYATTRDINQQIETNIVENEAESEEYEYWKSKLSPEQKLYYDELKEGFRNFESEIYTEQKHITKDQSGEVFTALIYDHPEIYWIGNINYKYFIRNNVIKRGAPIKLEYRFTREKILEYNTIIDRVAEDIVNAANTYTTDEEKVKFIHDTLIIMSEYEHEKDYTTPYYQSLVSLFVEGKAVCAGYATAFKYLMDKLDIDAVVVIGTSHNEYHAWNRVKLNDIWYNIDVTWDDYGSIMIGSSYYLLDDETFNLTHHATLEV